MKDPRALAGINKKIPLLLIPLLVCKEFKMMRRFFPLKRPSIRIAVLAAALAVALSASATPVAVTYTVSGTSGAWVLDFTVGNNLNPGQDIYIFGVLLPTTNILASPPQWANPAHFNPSNDGGPNVNFNNVWHLPVATFGTSNAIAAGNSLSGFQAGVNTVAAPTSVEWLAIAQDVTPTGSAPYPGNNNYNFGVPPPPGFAPSQENPGFVGTASPVPEPSSMFLIGTALVGLAPLRRILRNCR